MHTTANGNLLIPSRQTTIVAVASTAEATITVVSNGVLMQRTVQTATGNSSVRSFCHAACESSYNQLQVNDSLFIPENGSVNIVSGLDHPKTASHQQVYLPKCDPLVMTYVRVPSLSVYMYCRPGPMNNFSAVVTGVSWMSGSSWSAINPITCNPGDGVSVEDNTGLLFQIPDGRVYLFFLSSKGLSQCNVKTLVNFGPLELPDNCPWIAKLSQFDAVNIVAECTSGKNSQVVVVVWLYSILQGQFAQELPHRQYPLGQLTFSSDRLISAMWKGSSVQLKNLTGNNPPTATISASGVVDSVLIVGTGYNSLIVVATEDGVQKCDLHAVFAGRTGCTTLEGSEYILTRFKDPTCPAIQVGDPEDRVIVPTLNGTTYGIAMLSLNGDKPVFINGVRPARFAILPGGNTTTTAKPTVENEALHALYAFTGSPIVILILVLLVVVVLYGAWKWRRNKQGETQGRLDH